MRQRSIPYIVLFGAFLLSWFLFGSASSNPDELTHSTSTLPTETMRLHETETGMISHMESTNLNRLNHTEMTNAESEMTEPIRIKRCMQ